MVLKVGVLRLRRRRCHSHWRRRVTLHECLKAAELLGVEGIQARVVDCYSVKPIDITTVSESGGRHIRTDRRGGGTTIRKAGWDPQ